MTLRPRLLLSLVLFASLAIVLPTTAAAQVLVIEARVAPAPQAQVTPAPPASRVVVVPSSAPTYAPAYSDAPGTPHSRPVWRAVAAGAAMLGASWALNVVGSGLWQLAPDSWNRSGDFFFWSLVPIVGPWAQMGSMTDPSWQTPVLALDGLVQLAGFIVALVGQCSRETIVPRASQPSFALVPTASSQTIGLALSGTF